MAHETQPGSTADSPAARRNYARGLAVRERVLSAAAAVVNAQGFAGSSLLSIAAAAGLSKNHILHHFHTKDNLGLALLDAALSAWRSELSTPAQIYPGAAESLRFLLRRASELSQSGWPHLRLLGVLCAERGGLSPELQAKLSAGLDEIHTQLRAWAKPLKRSGALPQEHKARALAGLILGALLSAGSLSLPGDALGSIAALDALAALLLPGDALAAG